MTIIPEVVGLTGIVLKDSAVELQVGGQKKLEVIYTPENATYKELTWSSSNDAVAEVAEDGTVTAITAGSAEIIATSVKDDTLTVKCNVMVTTSDKLRTEKATFTTSYGVPLNGSLTDNVDNATGESVVYTLYEAPAQGIMTVYADGTFEYIPGIYPEERGNGGLGATYTFRVLLTAGDETTILEGEIIEKDLVETLSALESTDQHLLFSEELIADIRAAFQVEGSFKNDAWKAYKKYVDPLLKNEPPKYEDHTDDDNLYGGWQQNVGDQVMLLLGAYLITEEEAYKESAIKYAVASAGYEYWGEDTVYYEGGLIAAHQAFAIAMVYDWLKEDLTDEQEQLILNRLYYAGQRLYDQRLKDKKYLNNHMWIDNTALLCVALSLYRNADEAAGIIQADIDLSNNIKEFEGDISVEELEADCLEWLQWVCSDLGQVFYWLPDDGFGYESASYFEYGVSWLIKGSLLLENELGIDVFTGNEFFENCIECYSYLLMPEDYLSNQFFSINYADGVGRSNNQNVPIMSVLASKYKSSTARWIAETALEKSTDTGISHYWMTMFFADNEAEAELDTSSTMFYSENFGLVVSRSNWSGNEAILFAKCGLPLGKEADWVVLNSKSEYHCDPDANALILIANGEYLLKSDGRDYKDSKNHSTLLVNGMQQIGSPSISSTTGDKKNFVADDFVNLDLEPTMTVIESTDAYDYFMGDATEAYYPEAGLKKFQRNIIFLKEENVVLVVDDIKTSQNAQLQLRWFPESKTVAENYGIYSVYSTNNTLNFYPFTTDGVSTSFEALDVLNSTSETENAFAQNYNGSAWQNAVAFSWAPNGEAQTQVKYEAGKNTNEHLFEVNGKIYTLNVSKNTLVVEEGKLEQTNPWASDSTLSTILFNGFELDVFESSQKEYTLERFWKTMEVEIIPVASAPTAEVNMEWNGECPGVVTVTCTSEDNNSTTTYTLNLNNENGMLGIQSATAEPNTKGIDVGLTYDGYVSSDGGTKTWASINLPVVTYDMGRLVDISKIDVAFNYSSTRTNYYDLLVSADGVNWTVIKEAAGAEATTSGAFNDYQTIYSGDALRAQYVRLNLRANSESYMDDITKYGSIQEISIYGSEVIEEVMNPEIVENATDTSYTLGSEEDVIVTSTGAFSKFESVEMDDKIVDQSQYTVKEGSTIVIIKTEYLETLSVGEHTVTINFTDGSSVDSKLTIVAKTGDSDTDTDNNIENDDNTGDSNVETQDIEVTYASSTNTGDSSNMALWFGLMVVCLHGAVTTVTIKRKKN